MTELQKHSDVWGANGLMRFPHDLLSKIDIHKESIEFLVQVGLPFRSAIPLGSSFVLLSATSQPQNQERFHPPFLHRVGDGSYFAIGFVDYDLDFGHITYFCIKENQQTIHLIDKDDPKVYLVNSNLFAFVNSLSCYQTYLDADSANQKHRNERLLLKELRQGLRSADEATFRRRGSYWSIMLSDLAVQL